MSVQQQESITITTISNDSNNNHTTTTATTFVSKNGNHLQMTWERNIAMEILQRANQHHHHDNDKNSNHNDSSNSNIIPTTTTTPTPYMVAIAGIPGSGKSSSAEIITHIINNYYNHGISSSKDHTNHTINNTNHTNNTAICVCIPADGYHYDMKTLQDMEERNKNNNNDTTTTSSLIYRRGAPDTFNVTALLHDLQQIRYPLRQEPPQELPIVKLPGFDHAIGDPILHQHVYDRHQHQILIMEGLYLLYNQYQWDQIKDYFDETIYIQTHSIDTCMERLKQRNVVLPGYTIEEIHQRVDIVDRNNAILIDQVSPSRAHQVITSTTTTSVVVTATTTPPSL